MTTRLTTSEALYQSVYLKPDRDFQRKLEEALGSAFLACAEALHKDGIVALAQPFAAGRIEAMQQECETLMAAKVSDAHNHILYGGATNEQYLVGAPALSEALAMPIVWALGAHVWGRDPRLSYCRLYRIDSTAPKRYRAFQPHDDGHEKELKVMVLLSDVANSGQCMLYWRGTHRIAREVVSSRDTIISPDVVAKLGEPVRCSGPAGTVFIFNTKGIHSGQRNRSARRDALVFNITGGMRLYPVPVLASAVRDTLDPYRKSVLRVDCEQALDEDEDKLPDSIPARYLDAFLNLNTFKLDRAAQRAVSFTRELFAPVPRSDELPERLPARPRPREIAHTFPTPGRLSPRALADLRSLLPAAFAKDLIRGIDLRLCQYSGKRDRARDLQLCLVRDVHMSTATIARLVARIRVMNSGVFEPTVSSYQAPAREAEAFFANCANRCGDPELEHMALLAADLSACLRTAETVALLRTPMALLAGTLDRALVTLPISEQADHAESIRGKILESYAFLFHVQQAGGVRETIDLADVLS